jgi:hypothetical protein
VQAAYCNLGGVSIPDADLVTCCQRRLNIDPPCRSNIDPGRVAGF